VTAAYSIATEAMDPERGSETLMDLHPTSHARRDARRRRGRL
jgi:hypothetical protein